MTLHREPGKSHEPMRPRLITLDLASDFNPPLDSGGTVDWTAAGTKLTLRQLNKFFDKPQGVISISGGNVVLPRGAWRVRMIVEAGKSTTSAGSIGFAVTNAAGTTVHKECDDIEFPPVDCRMTVAVETIVKITAATDQIAFRAARRTAGSTMSIDAAYVGSIQKFANHGEVREV